MRKIACIPAICGGAPAIEGTRLTCADVSPFLDQAPLAQMLAVHPYLSRADIVYALR